MNETGDGVTDQHIERVDISGEHEAARWRCTTRIARLSVPAGLSRGDMDDLAALHRLQGRADAAGEDARLGQHQERVLLEAGVEPVVTTIEGNILVYGGISLLLQCLIGNGTATAGQALTVLSTARAALGVGDSSTAAANTQTDLQASTNKLRVGMNTGFPLHIDGTTSTSSTLTVQSSFGTSQANWTWREWGIFNSSTAGVGRMLNRRVENFGEKQNTQIWRLEQTIGIA